MGVMKRFSGIVRAKTNKALDKAENPVEMLDLSYEEQLENLQKIRRALADVTTAKKRLELQAGTLRQQADKLQDQAKDALSQDNEPLAREALSRRGALAQQLEGLGVEHDKVSSQQAQLQGAASRLQSQIEAFRTHKETLKATYSASKAQAEVNEAIAGISESMTDAGLTYRRAQDKIAGMQARAGALDELINTGSLPEYLASGTDDIQIQLDAASKTGQIDRELAALKQSLAGGPGPALDAGLPVQPEALNAGPDAVQPGTDPGSAPGQTPSTDAQP